MSRGTATLACLTLLCVAWDSAAGQGGSTSERSALAIRYEDGRSTDIHMNGTPLAPRLKGKAKVELGIAKGKKLHDKRETEKQRDWQRDKARLMRNRG